MPSSWRKTSNFEGADYSLDVDQKAMGSMKRELRTIFSKGDKLDETYIEVVSDLLGFSHKKKEQDKDDDPTYALFLESLEEDSNSYVLNVALSHGVFFPIKYEAKDDRYDKPERQTPTSSSSSFLQGSRSLDVNSDQESDMENFGSLKEDMLIHKRSSPSTGARLKSGPKRRCSEENNVQMNAGAKNPLSKSGEDIGHPLGRDPRADSVTEPYRVFISGLKVKGESIVYKCGDGKQVQFVESDQQKSTLAQNEPSKRVHRVQIPSSKPTVPAPPPGLATATTKAPTPTSKFRDKVGFRSSTETQISTKPLNLSATTTTTQTPRAPMSTPASFPRVSVGCSSGQDRRSKSRALASNESVLVFVCGLEADTEAVLQGDGDGKRVYHEESYKKPTDVRNEPLTIVSTLKIPTLRPPIRGSVLSEPNSIPKVKTPNPLNAPTPRPSARKDNHAVQIESSKTASKAKILNPRLPTPSPSQRDVDPSPTSSQRAPTTSFPTPFSRTSMQNNRCDMFGNLSKTLKNKRNDSRRSRHWFSEELERICQEPYRQKEYEDLLEQVSVRKCKVIHKNTRGKGYPVPGEMGKSYLDNYTDLDEEIKKVKSDPKKVLNLLRGFFFYLQHLPHGIPMPWKFAPWMKIMLGST